MIHFGKRRFLALAGLLLALVLPGCGGKDSHEKILKDTVDLMAQVATILEGVKDDPSAREAADRLNGLAAQFEALAERNEAIGPPDREAIQNLESAYREERASLQARLQKVTSSSFDDQSHPSLRKALDRIGQIVQAMR